MKTICGCSLDLSGEFFAKCKHGRRWALDSHSNLLENPVGRPTVVCLCGSTRFSKAFQLANLNETLKGNAVFTIGCDTKGDDELFNDMSQEDMAELKERLDVLHFRKIDMSDVVFILNVGGYIGKSTQRELDYARALGKEIRFLEEVTR